MSVTGEYLISFDAGSFLFHSWHRHATSIPLPLFHLHRPYPNDHHTGILLSGSHDPIDCSSPATYRPPHITNPMGMSSSPASAIVSNLSIAAATAVSRSWDCACGPSCALFIDHRCASQSGAGGRLALPGFWLAIGTIMVCWIVLVSGRLHDASPKTPQNVDGGHVGATLLTVTTALSTANNEEPPSTITHHALAGRSLPEKVEVKRSEPKAEETIDTTTTNIPATNPGATRIAILLALLLLSAMLVPMALAEPTSTSMPSTSLTLSSPSPCTTAFNATGTALSVENLQEKDKPQTWYWIPPNSSDRTSINSLLSLIPFLLMGFFFFLLPSFVGWELEKDITVVDDMVVGRDATPTSEVSHQCGRSFFRRGRSGRLLLQTRLRVQRQRKSRSAWLGMVVDAVRLLRWRFALRLILLFVLLCWGESHGR